MKNIDFHQLYIITKFSFLQEIRYKRSLKGKKRSYRTFISMLFIYIFSGVMMGFFSTQINLYSAAFFSSALFMILIGNFILLEFPTLITGPEDFFAYSSLPITSATYFYSKVFTVLIFVGIFSVCYSLPGAILLFQKSNNPFIFLGFLYPQFAGGIFISLLIINFYGILLKFVPLQTVKKVSTTLNFLLFFIFYGGYFLIFNYLRQYAHLFKVNFEGFFIFFPNAWGSSLFVLRDHPYAVLSLFLSLMIPVILLLTSRKIISIDFAERIAEQTLIRPKKIKTVKNSRPSILWKTFEEKAMALLIRSNFAHDVQFKLSILTIIPLTILYFIIVLFVYKGSLENPFTQDGILGFHKTLFLYVAIGFFPFYIKSALAYSQHAEASWIFFTTAYNRLNLILATRKFVFIFFMFPYFLLFFIIYVLMAGVIIPVILHFIVVVILAYIQTNIFLFFMTDIPFSKKPQRGRMLLSLLARMSVSVLLPVPLYLFVIFLYPRPLFYGILVASLVLIAGMVEFIGRKKAIKHLNREEFLY